MKYGWYTRSRPKGWRTDARNRKYDQAAIGGVKVKAYTVLGCTNDGAIYCPAHCPDPLNCDQDHGAIFAGSEWDCSPPTCDVNHGSNGEVLHEPIDGVTVIHYGDPCTYCGFTDSEED